MNEEIEGQFKDQSFVGKTIALDGSAFTSCVFSKCTMIYSGGEIPVLGGCRFEDCSWQFGGCAANTIAFLSGMYQGGFDRLIETTFHEIRRGAMVTQISEAKSQPAGTTGVAKYLKPLRIFRIPKQEP